MSTPENEVKPPSGAAKTKKTAGTPSLDGESISSKPLNELKPDGSVPSGTILGGGTTPPPETTTHHNASQPGTTTNPISQPATGSGQTATPKPSVSHGENQNISGTEANAGGTGNSTVGAPPKVRDEDLSYQKKVVDPTSGRSVNASEIAEEVVAQPTTKKTVEPEVAHSNAKTVDNVFVTAPSEAAKETSFGNKSEKAVDSAFVIKAPHEQSESKKVDSANGPSAASSSGSNGGSNGGNTGSNDSGAGVDAGRSTFLGSAPASSKAADSSAAGAGNTAVAPQTKSEEIRQTQVPNSQTAAETPAPAPTPTSNPNPIPSPSPSAESTKAVISLQQMQSGSSQADISPRGQVKPGNIISTPAIATQTVKADPAAFESSQPKRLAEIIGKEIQPKEIQSKENLQPVVKEAGVKDVPIKNPVQREFKTTNDETADRRVTSSVQQKQHSEVVTAKNSADIVKTLAKDEIVKALTDAIKKVFTEGKTGEVASILKGAVTDPVVREAIRTVMQGSSGGDGSGKAQTLTNLKTSDSQHARLDISRAASVESIQLPQPLTREQAMSALLGILVDASKLNSTVVQQLRSETTSKVQMIEAAVPELVRNKFEQLIALNGKLQNIAPALTAVLLHNAVQELATSLGLTPEQRALISVFNIQLSTIDYGDGIDPANQKRPPPKAGAEAENEKDRLKAREMKESSLRELTPEERERLLQEQLYELEEFLKERDEVKLKRAQEELEKILQDSAEEDVEYMIDGDFEVVKTYTILGRVVRRADKSPIAFTKIYAGLLGTFETDVDGTFKISNVPEQTAYMIGADKIGYVFEPEYFGGTLTGGMMLEFLGDEIH